MDSSIIGVHHLGIAVQNIAKEAEIYCGSMGFEAETGILREPPQKVDVQFLVLNGFRIELIQATSEDSPILGFIKKGGILNHICYESSDIEATVKKLKKDTQQLKLSKYQKIQKNFMNTIEEGYVLSRLL